MSYNLTGSNSGFVSLSSGAIAIGTNAGTFKTASTLTFTNNGVFKSKAATDNLTFTAGHTSLANSQACLFALWINTSGTVSTSQGPIVSAGEPCPVPGQPAVNLTLFGLIKVSTSSSQTFVPGTNTLGTGNTTTYLDCMTMPGSAQ